MYSGQARLSGTVVSTDTRDAYLVQQMHARSQAIYSAKQRQDVAAVQRLLAEFKVFADEYRERGAIGVSPFDSFVIATGKWIEDALAAIPGAIAAPLNAISFGLIKGLWPVALLVGAALYAKGKL